MGVPRATAEHLAAAGPPAGDLAASAERGPPQVAAGGAEVPAGEQGAGAGGASGVARAAHGAAQGAGGEVSRAVAGLLGGGGGRDGHAGGG